MISLSLFTPPLLTHPLHRKYYSAQKRAHFKMRIDSYFKRSHIVWLIFIVKLELPILYQFLQERPIHAKEVVISYWIKQTLSPEVLVFTSDQY